MEIVKWNRQVFGHTIHKYKKVGKQLWNVMIILEIYVII